MDHKKAFQFPKRHKYGNDPDIISRATRVFQTHLYLGLMKSGNISEEPK